MNLYSSHLSKTFVSTSTFKRILSCFMSMWFLVDVLNAQTSMPNVLLICVDDLRPALGAYGDTYAITPNIDELANDSYVYKQAYVQQSVCNPSRVSMLTGLRPSTTNIYDLETHIRDELVNVITLPQLFKNNGFKAIGFGKIFHNNLNDPASWSEPLYYVKNLPKWKLAKNIELAVDGYGPSTEFTSGFEDTFRDVMIANEAIEKVRNHDGNPFFMAVGFIRPHLPFVAPNKFFEMYKDREPPDISMVDFPVFSPEIAHTNFDELRNYSDIPKNGRVDKESGTDLTKSYYACVSFIDSLIGNLINELKEQDLYDNTLIVLWGDHGFKLGEFGAWTKHTNYDIDTRVPLIMKDVTNRHEERGEIVEAIDIYKTLAEYFNFLPSQRLEGDNLFHQPPPDSLEYAISFTHRDIHIGISIRTDRFRYVLWSNGEQELYDFDYFGEYMNVSKYKAYKNVVVYLSNFLESKKFETEDFVDKHQIQASPIFIITQLDGSKENLKITLKPTQQGDISFISQLQIIDINGNVVCNKTFDDDISAFELSISQFAPGVYIAIVQNRLGQIVKNRFLINH